MLNKIELVVRDPNFNFESIKKNYLDGSPFLTAFFNTFSAFIPSSEKDIGVGIAKNLSKLGSTALAENAKKFNKQEGMHTKYHNLFNKKLEEIGYAAEVNKIDKLATQIGFGNIFRHSPAMLIAGAAAIEHFNRLLGIWTLGIKEGVFLEKETEKLMLWHCAEEAEHYHIAHEVCLEAKVFFYKRFFAFVYVLLSVNVSLIHGVVLFLKKDHQLFKFRNIRDAFHLLFTKKYSRRVLCIELLKTIVWNCNPFYRAKNTHTLESNFFFEKNGMEQSISQAV